MNNSVHVTSDLKKAEQDLRSLGLLSWAQREEGVVMVCDKHGRTDWAEIGDFVDVSDDASEFTIFDGDMASA